MFSKSKLLATTCLGAIAMTGAAAPTIAQDSDDQELVLDEIIVTARLREESLQSTPLSITAMTGDMLEERNITSARQMLDQTPGVYFTNQGGPGLGNVSIRGLTQGSLIGDEANVATFIDGFYYAGRISFDGFIDGMERVEVVRGPQSALYGRNSFSGAINYITKKPDHDGIYGTATGTLGQDGRRELAGSINLPLIEDKLAMRMDISHHESGSTWKNSVNGERLGDTESDNIRAQFRFTPTDATTIDYAYTRLRRNATDQPLFAIPAGELDGGFKFDFITFGYRNHKSSMPRHRPANDLDRHVSDLIGSNYKVDRHTFKLDHEFEKMVATVMIASTTEDMRAISDATYGAGGDIMLAQLMPTMFGFPAGAPEITPIDLDGNFIPDQFPVVGGQPIQDRKDFSGEIRFQSKGDSKVDWAFGGFFSRLKYDDKLETGYDLDPATVAAVVGYAPDPDGPGPAGTMNLGLIPATYDCNPMAFPFVGCASPFGPTMLEGWFVDGDSIYLLQEKYFKNEETSVFGSLGFDLNDSTRLTVEGRYTWEDRYMEDLVERTGMFNNNFPTPISKSYKTFTPRVILDYQVNDDTFLYAIAGKGAKAGGVQPSASAGTTFYDPEKNWTYEVGGKFTLLNGRMNLNTAAFRIDWTDMQLRENVGLDNVVTNIGKAQVDGFEIMGAWKVDDNVQFRFGYTYQDGTITEGSTVSAAGFCDLPHMEHERVAVSATVAGILATTNPAGAATCDLQLDDLVPGIVPGVPFASAGTVSVTTGDISGHRMSNAPKHTFNYGLDVDIPVSDKSSIFMTADYAYRSSMFFDFENFAKAGSTNVINGSIGVQTGDVRFSLWVENLTNEDTPIGGIRNFNILGQSLASVQHRQGRMFGATLSTKF